MTTTHVHAMLEIQAVCRVIAQYMVPFTGKFSITSGKKEYCAKSIPTVFFCTRPTIANSKAPKNANRLCGQLKSLLKFEETSLYSTVAVKIYILPGPEGSSSRTNNLTTFSVVVRLLKSHCRAKIKKYSGSRKRLKKIKIQELLP